MPRKQRACKVCGAVSYGDRCRIHCQSRAPRGPYRPRGEAPDSAWRASLPQESWWVVPAEQFYETAKREQASRNMNLGVAHIPQAGGER